MAAITEPAWAKLNLFLHVGAPLPNGRHPLDSLVVFPRVGDTIRVEAATDLSLELTGPFAHDLSADPDNLVLKAARALAEAGGIPPKARITLEKNLPVASGIGGGSADAAATLRALSSLWRLKRSEHELHAIAAELGADVPVCIASQTARMGGTGEALSKPPLVPPDIPVVLVNPGIAVSTAAAFARFDQRGGGASFGPHRFPDCGSMASLAYALRQTRNDLEAAARDLCPPIGEVLDALAVLPRVLLARMAGSGATCFALFDRRAEAEQAARLLKDAYPDWWVVAASAKH